MLHSTPLDNNDNATATALGCLMLSFTYTIIL